MRSIASITAGMVLLLRLYVNIITNFLGDGYCRGKNLPLLLEARKRDVQRNARKSHRLVSNTNSPTKKEQNHETD